MNKVFRLLFIIVLLVAFTGIGLPQAISPLNVSIKIDNPILQRAQPVLVHAKIKWGSVPDAKAEKLRAVSLQLTKPRTEPNDCRLGECIVTTYWLPKQLEPKAGELIEFNVVLTDLYWKDVISSYFDLSQPKNMFDVIPAGAYSLSMSTGFRANSSTRRDPRVIQVASNSVSVEVR